MAEMALEELENNYGPSNYVPLIWHVLDSLGTPETQARYDYYGVLGIPDTYFDGIDNINGAWPKIYDDFEEIILNHLDDDPFVAIDLSGSHFGPPTDLGREGGTVQIHLTVEQTIPWEDVQIFTIIYEEYVDGQYMYTVRDVLPVESLLISQPGETQDIVKSFNLDPSWNPADVGIIVFLQSVGTKVVLNACKLSEVDVEITPETATVPMGSNLNFTVDLRNITQYSQSFEAWLDVILPNGNEYQGNPYVGPLSLDLTSRQTPSQDLTLPIPNGIPAADYRLRVGVGNQGQPDHWEYDYMTVTVTP